MRHLTLDQALELVILYAEAGDAKFERAACRWLNRLMVERDDVTLAQVQFAVAALSAVRDDRAAAAALRSLTE